MAGGGDGGGGGLLARLTGRGARKPAPRTPEGADAVDDVVDFDWDAPDEETAAEAASAAEVEAEIAADETEAPDLGVPDWRAAPTNPDDRPLLRPEEWDQSVPVYAALAGHRAARQSPAALKTAIDKINDRPREFWRRKTRRFFNAAVERNMFAAAEPAPPGHLRSFDVLPYERLLFNMTRGINWYASNHGFEPKVFNPTRFSEKLLLAKFFAPVPMPSPGDKLGNHRYIPPAWREIVRVPKRFWSGHTPHVPMEIDAPPGTYLFKANHASGANLKITLPFDEATHARVCDLADRWLKADYGWRGGEWWYQQVHRRVFIEEAFADHGASATDWKIFVLNGKAALVQVDLDRDQDHVQLLYDRDFTFLPSELFFKSGKPIEKPANFHQIIDAAEAIGRQFEFARVDFYNTGEGLVLGEITLAPGGARLRLRSPELDVWLGEKWASGFFKPGWRPKTDLRGF